jgi:TetR/AcrR family transcriptional regulator, tetracycline repressor protein
MDVDLPDAVAVPSPRAGRPAMPRDQIVAAALELVDAHGADDFSLRMLAKHLNSSTATLYRHFSNKEDLLAGVGESVLGEVKTHLPAHEAEWRAELFAAAEALYFTFERHPHMVSVLGDRVALGQNGLLLREYVLAALLNAGFAPQVASQAFTSITRYTIGFCSQLGRPDSSTGEAGRALQEHFGTLDPARYPATVTSAPFLPTGLRDEFLFGLTLLLNGLSLHLERRGM